LFDPVKSAEPPTVSGMIGLTTSNTFSELARVASLGAVSESHARRSDTPRAPISSHAVLTSAGTSNGPVFQP